MVYCLYGFGDLDRGLRFVVGWTWIVVWTCWIAVWTYALSGGLGLSDGPASWFRLDHGLTLPPCLSAKLPFVSLWFSGGWRSSFRLLRAVHTRRIGCRGASFFLSSPLWRSFGCRNSAAPVFCAAKVDLPVLHAHLPICPGALPFSFPFHFGFCLNHPPTLV